MVSKQGLLGFGERQGAPPLLEAERWARAQGLQTVCGVDEVGRGPLAGPVVAAATVLGDDLAQRLCAEGLDDSKKLRERKREALGKIIRAEAAFGVAEISVEMIDRMNILKASQEAMRQAVARLEENYPEALCRSAGTPDALCLLVDGHLLLEPSPLPGVMQRAVVKGDSRCAAIAAASVIAKVHRDALMVELDARYPGYGLARNKGYPTAPHREALLRLGPTSIHRRTFKGVLPVPESSR